MSLSLSFFDYFLGFIILLVFAFFLGFILFIWFCLRKDDDISDISRISDRQIRNDKSNSTKQEQHPVFKRHHNLLYSLLPFLRRRTSPESVGYSGANGSGNGNGVINRYSTKSPENEFPSAFSNSSATSSSSSSISSNEATTMLFLHPNRVQDLRLNYQYYNCPLKKTPLSSGDSNRLPISRQSFRYNVKIPERKNFPSGKRKHSLPELLLHKVNSFRRASMFNGENGESKKPTEIVVHIDDFDDSDSDVLRRGGKGEEGVGLKGSLNLFVCDESPTDEIVEVKPISGLIESESGNSGVQFQLPVTVTCEFAEMNEENEEKVLRCSDKGKKEIVVKVPIKGDFKYGIRSCFKEEKEILI